MITSKSGQYADNATNYVHGCFMVSVGTDFRTYQDIMNYAQQDERYAEGSSKTPAIEPNVKTILGSIATSPDTSTNSNSGPALPVYFSKRKCRDTSLGGNDAINPLPQFSVDDDIVHPHFVPNFVPGGGMNVGMGQVYSENYDDTAQILYMGFGIPLFSNVGSFWAKAVDMDMANFVNKGSGMTAEKIGYLLGSAPIRLVNIATIPFKFIYAMVNSLQQVPISKYYSFSSQMPMYFRFVNTILVYLATNMNIMGSSIDYSTTGSNTSDTTSLGLLNNGTIQTDDMSGMSSTFQNFGLDMARVMLKRYLYENGSKGTLHNRYTDQGMFMAANISNVDDTSTTPVQSGTQSTNAAANGTNSQTATDGATDADARLWTIGWIDAFKAAYTDAIYDGHLFIGFRIDKGMGATESFSNSTGESQIAQTANSKFQEGQEAAFATMHGDIGNSKLGELLTGALSAAKGVISGAAAMFKLDPLAAVATGAAKIDIPEVWMSSNYSRSASFSLTCMAPYGDMETIFQSLYVPFACLLAGTLPRGTGLSSHASPFICQVYCRGVFSSPLCMIESLEVVRGSDQFGFTKNRLPLKLSIHVSLKDLTPAMYMTMGGEKGLANAIMGTDDNFGEYMLTLSGMGLRDRLSPFRSMRRKTQILLTTLYENKLSPFMLGMEGGSRFMISRMISAVKSGGRGIPGN